MDKTWENQLEDILEKLEVSDPKQLPSLEEYVKVCEDEWDTNVSTQSNQSV